MNKENDEFMLRPESLPRESGEIKITIVDKLSPPKFVVVMTIDCRCSISWTSFPRLRTIPGHVTLRSLRQTILHNLSNALVGENSKTY